MNPQEYWNESYRKGPDFTDLGSGRPSEAVTKFVTFLKEKGLPLQGNLLDVGTGLGRNANWLAHQGFKVTGVDVSDVAILKASQQAKKLKVDVNYKIIDVASGLPFDDNSFDYVTDILVSQLFNSQERKKYKGEVVRVLKPGGKLLLYTLDRSKDLSARQLVKDHPGPEKNTYSIPDSGLVERTFTLEEIEKLWQPLRLEAHELLYVPSPYKGKVYKRYFWWIILAKSPIHFRLHSRQ